MPNNINTGYKLEEHYTNYPTRLLYLPRGVARLAALGVKRRFGKGEIIVKQDTCPTHCFVVIRGRVITYEYSCKGNERIYNYLEEESVFLEANLLMNTPPPVSFRAAVPSELACISRDDLIRGMRDDYELNIDVIESIAYKFLASMDQIRETTAHNAEWKICNLLLIFADRFGVSYDGKLLIRQNLGQQMISNLLGINRITTVRIIKALKNLGLIEIINGFYCIRDAEKLKLHLEYCDMCTSM